jgi:uncharacterized protein YbbK (DUF523 family)
MKRIRVGVSRCLLGDAVRHDGGHKYDPVIASLTNDFEWVPVCPEVEIGMPVPREAVHLVDGRMIGVNSQRDWTDQMLKYSQEKALYIKDLGICGYIFKSKSPSCGLFEVRGLFASTFCILAPLIPVEEEQRLHDPALRENFILRVWAVASSES